MSSREDFTTWLQGFFDLTDSKHLTEKQVLMIKEHLKLAIEKDKDQPKFSFWQKDTKLGQKTWLDQHKPIVYLPMEPLPVKC